MNPNTTSGEIEATAAEWFAMRESREWSAADQAQLEAWLNSSTAHRIAFVRLVTAWERSGRLQALGAGVPAGVIPPRDAWLFAPDSSARPKVAPKPVAMARSSRLRAVAALVVVAAAAGTAWYFVPEHGQYYRTPVGGRSTVPLADGSKITLNTDSEIHVEFGPTLRRVKLDQGEAYFDVSKDAVRPFVVDVADERVTAVGTQFSVRRDHDDIRVIVTEGRVWIERRGDGSKAGKTQLAAGSEARTSKTAVLIAQPPAAQVEQLLSWRNGYLVFRDTALADAVADFNRYSVRKIIIQDPAIAGIRIGGNFRCDDAEAFLWLLQSGFPIHVEQRSNRIILTKS
ncbi:MAG: FecR domain-containing protein [Steroidobacteraceae bacterium]